MIRLTAVLALITTIIGCDEDKSLPVEQLRDPNTCQECHPQHFEQWQSSMHAYASDDPVFVAMNKRGQRETNGALGDFCIKCHAPLAVELGLATGANFDPAALPPEARGITCYFCHNVAAVDRDHNNGLVLAHDQVMRGGVTDPVKSPAHFSRFDPLMDSDRNQSEICGACHDITVPASLTGGTADIALERTFAEWKQTFFATESDPLLHFTCGACHMVSKRDLIADAPGLGTRPRDDGFHAHTFPAIDLALTPWPGIDVQIREVQAILDPSVNVVGPFNAITKQQHGGICLDPDSVLRIRIDNLGAAHAWPSGAAQDRRAWLEVKAFDATGAVVFSSGVTAPDTDPIDSPGFKNVATVGLWDRTFDAANQPTHFFWDVARIESQLMPIPEIRGGDHSRMIEFDITNPAAIDRIETRLLFRPLPYALLDDLIASGDLAADIRDKLVTLEVGGGRSVWTRATQGTGTAVNTRCNPRPPPP